jgi:hypothetical protein
MVTLLNVFVCKSSFASVLLLFHLLISSFTEDIVIWWSVRPLVDPYVGHVTLLRKISIDGINHNLCDIVGQCLMQVDDFF